MNTAPPKRRSFLLGLGGLGLARFVQSSAAPAQTAPHGYVLASAEGEHLVHFRDHGDIFIKASAATGSSHLALGTQRVMPGSGIPVHRHFDMDECFYILEGGGTFLLNDEPHPIEAGATVFIPRNSWHGFQNPGRALLLLWIVAPPGLDGFFRETCNPPGVPPKSFTHDQINAIARKYGTEFR
ncbi:cupin domain-containing protein [Acidobacteria bacterium AB60]|nr:cupin domain-containing protein [Acidobacteria bacterium AB60]